VKLELPRNRDDKKASCDLGVLAVYIGFLVEQLPVPAEAGQNALDKTASATQLID
jgi:hypothetical protein